MPAEPELTHAPPSTLLGQLQRGLGDGVRRALAGAPGAREAVLECIAHDPRIDRQLDQQAESYAWIAEVLGISAAEIGELRVTHAARTDPSYLDREPFPLEVLGRLAERGDLAAVGAQRREAAAGRTTPPAGPRTLAPQFTWQELLGLGTHLPSPRRGALVRAFERRPFEESREVATRWLRDDPDGLRRTAGAGAFAAHAEPADVPFVRAMLTRELDSGEPDPYVICSLAEALGRQPGNGPYLELLRAYREMLYAFGRRFVVEALAATEPLFASTIAVDGLWDCGSSVRRICVERVDLAVVGARERLTEIAADPVEDSECRAAAAARLSD